jgi:hypothetical protein
LVVALYVMRHSGERRNPACLWPKLDARFHWHDGNGWWRSVVRHWPQPQPPVIPAKAGIQLVYAQSWMPAFAGMTALGGGALSYANGKGITPNRPSFRRKPESSLFMPKAGCQLSLA